MSTLRTDTIVDYLGGNNTTVNGVTLNYGVLSREDRIINGDFAIWERRTANSVTFGDTTATTSNSYGVDRWRNAYIGGAVSQQRRNFTLDDTMIGMNTPKHFLRQIVSGQSLESHFALTTQRIESVRSYAGQTITVLGWARRSSGAGNMAVNIGQYFGSGTTNASVTIPASDSIVVPGQTVTLSNTWEPFAVTFDVPSIVGKRIGIFYDDDWLEINFWTSAGSDFAMASNSLGVQTISADLWGIHIKRGTHNASVTDQYYPRDIGTELAACQRYFNTFGGYRFSTGDYERSGMGQAYSSISAEVMVSFPVLLRKIPTLSYTGNWGLSNSVMGVLPVTSIVPDSTTRRSINLQVTAAAGGLVAGNATQFFTNNDNFGSCMLNFDAEL